MLKFQIQPTKLQKLYQTAKDKRKNLPYPVTFNRTRLYFCHCIFDNLELKMTNLDNFIEP